MSITLHAATQAIRLRRSGTSPKHIEGHPMDHDSHSSGHTNKASLIPLSTTMDKQRLDPNFAANVFCLNLAPFAPLREQTALIRD